MSTSKVKETPEKLTLPTIVAINFIMKKDVAHMCYVFFRQCQPISGGDLLKGSGKLFILKACA